MVGLADDVVGVVPVVIVGASHGVGLQHVLVAQGAMPLWRGRTYAVQFAQKHSLYDIEALCGTSVQIQ